MNLTTPTEKTTWTLLGMTYVPSYDSQILMTSHNFAVSNLMENLLSTPCAPPLFSPNWHQNQLDILRFYIKEFIFNRTNKHLFEMNDDTL